MTAAIRTSRTPPECAAIGQYIHFVEEHAPIPKRLAFILNIWRLPGIDGVAPGCGILQSVTRDGPGVGPGCAVEVGIAAIPFATLAKLHDREIPCNDHRDQLLLSRLESQADCDGTGQLFAVADPRSGVIRQATVFCEMAPDSSSITVCWKRYVVADFNSGRLDGGDGELTIRFTGRGSSAIAVEHNPLHQSGRDFLAGKFIVVPLVGCALKIASEGAKPAHHVRPGKKKGNRDGFAGRILRMPAIDRDRIA